MPSRMIRDGLIESQAVLSMPADGRWLFVSLMLTADDLGLFEATIFSVARKSTMSVEMAAKLLSQLADADLIRLYSVADKTFGFIPNFGQRLQIKRTRYPVPPLALLHGDQDAINKFNSLGINPTVDHGCPTLSTVVQPPEPEPEPEVKKREPTVLVGKASPYRPPPCPNDEIVGLYHSRLPALPAVAVLNDSRKRAISSRWRDVCASEKFDKAAGLEWFDWYFSHVAKSSFLMGQTPGKSGRIWRADIDFLMTANKFPKVIEGAYHGGQAA